MHNDKYKKQFSSITKIISLSDEEKHVMRSHLLSRMRNGRETVFAQQGFFVSLLSILLPLRAPVMGLLGIFVVTSTIVYSAEYTLPGDTLYPIKVEVNERLWGLTAVSYEAQAEWSVKRTTRRLQELEQLATTGSLDEKARNELTSRFEQQAAEANKAIVKLKTEQIDRAANTSSQLEFSLRIHERMLTQVAQRREDISGQLRAILDAVREKAESVSEIRLEIEKEIAKTQNNVNNEETNTGENTTTVVSDKEQTETSRAASSMNSDTKESENATTTQDL